LKQFEKIDTQPVQEHQTSNSSHYPKPKQFNFIGERPQQRVPLPSAEQLYGLPELIFNHLGIHRSTMLRNRKLHSISQED